VAALLTADLVSKSVVFAWIGGLRERGELTLHECGLLSHPRYPLAGDWLSFMLTLNPGAAFGQLGEYPNLLIGGRVVAVLFLLWLLVRTPSKRVITVTALTLVLSGALGNLYDNLFLDDPHDAHPFGKVRDFIDVYFAAFDWHFPTFNVADSCITVGAILLLYTSLFGKEASS
jgi:signal peptidase II